MLDDRAINLTGESSVNYESSVKKHDDNYYKYWAVKVFINLCLRSF